MHFVKKHTELRKLASASFLSESVRSPTLSADPFSIDLWSDTDKVILTSLARQVRIDETLRLKSPQLLRLSSKKVLRYPSDGKEPRDK